LRWRSFSFRPKRCRPDRFQLAPPKHSLDKVRTLRRIPQHRRVRACQHALLPTTLVRGRRRTSPRWEEPWWTIHFVHLKKRRRLSPPTDTVEFLAAKGFLILAIDFRGHGCSTGPGQADFFSAPFPNDVLAAVNYLKLHGAKTVSVIGGSFGGAAAGDASIMGAPAVIDRIVFLGAAPNLSADKLKSRTLYIVAREDRDASELRLPGIRAQYDKSPQPKELIILDGSAHAQFLFQTDQNDRVMHEIERFLSMP
jgi:pimeloyl-ACP methyl ester carboxylesterase